MWSGITLAIMNGLLVYMISDSVDSADPNSQMMKGILTLISLGFGEILGSLFIGKIIDKYGNRLTSFLILAAIII
jgi:MFS family permease